MTKAAARVEEPNLGNRKQEATDAPNPTEENIPKEMAAASAVGKERKIENLEKTDSCNDQNRRIQNPSFFSYDEQTEAYLCARKATSNVNRNTSAAPVFDSAHRNANQQVEEYPNLPSEEEFLEAYAGGHQATAQFPVLGHHLPEEHDEYHQQYLPQVEELHYQQFRTQVEGWLHFILQTQLQARLRNISNQQGRGTGVYHPIGRGGRGGRDGRDGRDGRGGRGGPYGRYGRGAQPHDE